MSAVIFCLRECFQYQLCRFKATTQFMAHFTKERLLSGVKLFEISGCDFFGPLIVIFEHEDIKYYTIGSG